MAYNKQQQPRVTVARDKKYSPGVGVHPYVMGRLEHEGSKMRPAFIQMPDLSDCHLFACRALLLVVVHHATLVVYHALCLKGGGRAVAWGEWICIFSERGCTCSGLSTATAQTSSLCPWSVNSQVPDFKSQSFSVLSSLADTTRDLSIAATAETAWLCP